MNVQVELKPVVEFDNALNEAGWMLLAEVQKHQAVNSDLWNNMKGCLKVAIEKYIEVKLGEQQ